nr:MAG TPA: hypothetical protein [Caudoviricetes sp.]
MYDFLSFDSIESHSRGTFSFTDRKSIRIAIERSK